MALIAEEHPKFLATPNPELRLKLWSSTLAKVPFECGSAAVMLALAESPYEPKLADVISRVKAMYDAKNKEHAELKEQYRQMISMHRIMGKESPPEWVAKYKELEASQPLMLGIAEMGGTRNNKGR